MPIRQNIRGHAARDPEKIAYHCEDGSRSYAELIVRADRIARFIAAMSKGRSAAGLLPDLRSVVVLDVGARLQFPELFLAATEPGSACAIIDPKMPERQVRTILQKLQPDWVITQAEDTLVARLAQESQLNVISLSALEERLSQDVPLSPPIEAADQDTFLISFTSGTTSEPKAFSRSRGAWERSLARGYEHFGLQAAPNSLCPGSFAYGIALYAFCEALHSGATYFALDKWNADLVADSLRTQGVERLTAVPTMITGLATRNYDDRYPDVRKVITAGAKMSAQHVADIRRIFPNAEIKEYYGASELGFIATAQVYPAQPDVLIETVGTAYPGVTIFVVDETGKEQARNCPGTIYVRSDLVCDGYLWGDDGKAFRRDDCGFTVGDFGMIDPNGVLRVLGRQGGMIISGGNNIYPSEVETALKALHDVDEAVVFGLPDTYLGARVIAVLSGQQVNAGKISEQLKQLIPPYKIPREFYVTASWPLTSNGKIARAEVEKRLRDGEYARI